MTALVDHPESYFRRLIPTRDRLLMDLEAEAARENIPIVGPVVGELLYILARAGQAETVLELGTATGYSAIFLGRALDAERGRLVTVENDPKMARRAEENLRQAGLMRVADVVVGDAINTLRRLQGRFDMIFLDIEKTDYVKVLPECRRLLRKGGLLIADNVGFKDADPFNREIFSTPDWKTVHLYAFLPEHSPEHDGLCLALRS